MGQIPRDHSNDLRSIIFDSNCLVSKTLGTFPQEPYDQLLCSEKYFIDCLGFELLRYFSFAWFYGTKRERFQISNPQGELQTLSELKTNMVDLMKELSARMQQYLGLNRRDQCGSIGAVHYKFWDARIDSDHHERSKNIISAIDKVLKLED